MLAVLLPSLRSVAVTVKLPLVLNETVKAWVPDASAELAGKVAVESLEVMPTVSDTVFTTFQLASTALTVRLKLLKAICAVGVPVLPLAVPGAAVSPGARSCSLANAPTFTVTEALVLAVSVPAASLAVMVRVPPVLKVKLDKVRVPRDNVRLPAVAPLSSAIAALLSELVMVTFGVAVATTFQLASTALSVTLKAVPAVRAVGAPVLPRLVPGAAVSPGTNNCSFVNAPALTVIAELVLAVLLPSVMSVAVTVWLPPVMRVTLKVCVPLANAPLGGPAMAGSLEVKPRLSTALFTKFQKASTALTVTLKAVPDV